MMNSHNNKKFLLVLMIVTLVACCFITTITNATKSECYKPGDADTERRRGVAVTRVVLSHSDSEEGQHLTLSTRFTNIQPKKEIYQPSFAVGGPRHELIEYKIVQAMNSKAKQHISLNPRVFNSKTGPTNLLLKQKLTFKGTKQARCVACRLTCLALNVFKECRDQYYYYGCRQKEECYRKETVDKTVIQTAIGICIDKNGCKLKKAPDAPNGVVVDDGKLLKFYMDVVTKSAEE